jgi:thiamine monophosphate kinase
MRADEIIDQADPEAIVWDGFDEAIIGHDNRGRLVYDIDLMVETLTREDEMSEEEAMEFLDYNTLNTFVGDLTPIHIYINK